MACISGYVAVVDELLAAGANANISDRHYWYPIHRASLWSHTAVMHSLIKTGIDVNIEDEEVCFVFMGFVIYLFSSNSSCRKVGSLRGCGNIACC